MLKIPAESARRLRSLVRKQAGRPRGPDPPVLIGVADGVLRLQARLERSALELELPTTASDCEPQLYCLGNLDRHEGPTPCAGPVEPLAVPERMQPMSVDLLPALNEAWRTTACESGRYALTHVQFLGQRGEIVATDGRQALIQRGFQFPFRDDVLVHASPLFGMRDWTSARSVSLGRGEGVLVIRAGRWTLHLSIDDAARFPDVGAAMPRSLEPTLLHLDGIDAMRWLDRIALLPCADRGSRRAMIVGGATPTVWLWSDTHATPLECPLENSTLRGPLPRVAGTAQDFARALALGLRSFRFVAGVRPWVARDERRLYFAVSVDTTDCPFVPIPEPKEAMTVNANALSPIPARVEVIAAHVDPIKEAETLRDLIGELHARLVKLVALLQSPYGPAAGFRNIQIQ